MAGAFEADGIDADLWITPIGGTGAEVIERS